MNHQVFGCILPLNLNGISVVIEALLQDMDGQCEECSRIFTFIVGPNQVPIGLSHGQIELWCCLAGEEGGQRS